MSDTSDVDSGQGENSDNQSNPTVVALPISITQAPGVQLVGTPPVKKHKPNSSGSSPITASYEDLLKRISDTFRQYGFKLPYS